MCAETIVKSIIVCQSLDSVDSKSDKLHYIPQALWLFVSICVAAQSKYPDDCEVWLYSALKTMGSGCFTQNCYEKLNASMHVCLARSSLEDVSLYILANSMMR